MSVSVIIITTLLLNPLIQKSLSRLNHLANNSWLNRFGSVDIIKGMKTITRAQYEKIGLQVTIVD